MPILEKACYCLELAIGTTILGWLWVILSILTIIGSFVQMAEPEINGFVVTLSIGISELITSGLLIRGAMTRNVKLVMPWLIVAIVNITIANITVILASCGTASFSLIILIVIVDLIVGYLWTIVYSFYQQLETPGGGTF